MKRVNEIFYSLQGEGHNTGRAAIFVRLAGCNLRCAFCDTDFHAYTEMSDEDILQAIAPYEGHFVVITGGEPTLQVDEGLIDLLHRHGYEVAMETNGTHPLPRNLDWSTVSPKALFFAGERQKAAMPVVKRCNELKCVFAACGQVDDFGIEADYYYLQPCDTGNEEVDRLTLKRCIDYIKRHPRWRLSLQTHKMIGVR